MHHVALAHSSTHTHTQVYMNPLDPRSDLLSFINSFVGIHSTRLNESKTTSRRYTIRPSLRLPIYLLPHSIFTLVALNFRVALSAQYVCIVCVCALLARAARSPLLVDDDAAGKSAKLRARTREEGKVYLDVNFNLYTRIGLRIYIMCFEPAVLSREALAIDHDHAVYVPSATHWTMQRIYALSATQNNYNPNYNLAPSSNTETVVTGTHCTRLHASIKPVPHT